jgi:Na+-driven multidrug efflux pump
VGIAELFPKAIFSVFTNDKELIEYGTGAFVTVVSMMWVMGIYTTGTGIHQALGKKTSSFILSIMRWVLLIIPLVLILPKFLIPSVDGIWLAFPIADLLAALITLLKLRRTLRIHGILSPSASNGKH